MYKMLTVELRMSWPSALLDFVYPVVIIVYCTQLFAHLDLLHSVLHDDSVCQFSL